MVVHLLGVFCTSQVIWWCIFSDVQTLHHKYKQWFSMVLPAQVVQVVVLPGISPVNASDKTRVNHQLESQVHVEYSALHMKNDDAFVHAC